MKSGGSLKLWFGLVAAMAAAFGLWATTAFAHEGHEHGGPKVEIVTAVAPRFDAASPDFELVGVLRGKELIVYLDRFRTNERIPDATITATANGDEVKVEPIGDGTYRITSPLLSQPERIEFIFTITTADATDLLAGSLEVAKPKAMSVGPEGWRRVLEANQTVLLASAIGFMLGVLSVLIVRFKLRRSRRRNAPEAETEPPSGETAKAKSPGLPANIRRIGAAGLFGLLAFAGMPSEGRADAGRGEVKPQLTITADLPQRLPDGSLFVPKETQHLLTVRTVMAGESNAARTAEVTGQIIADPNGFGRVQSPVDGRIDTPENGLPLVGQKVEKGQLLAYVVPIIPTADVSVYASTVGEIDTQIALAEQKLGRISRIPGVIPQKDIDDTRTELEGLKKRRASVRASLGERQAMTAPISGVLSLANAVPGQLATARDTIFEIVDPQKLWVEAISFDPRLVSEIVEASAVTTTGETLKLKLIGRGLALRQQGTPITFAIDTPSATLGIGQPVTVIVKTKTTREGMVLPQAAVVRGANGVSIVWTHIAGERFKPNVVKYQALDGERVVIDGGLKPNERVVIEGATLLNQIR